MFIGTQAVNFRPSTDHQKFTHKIGVGDGKMTYVSKFLIFDPPKKSAGKNPQISTNFAERPSIGNS